MADVLLTEFREASLSNPFDLKFTVVNNHSAPLDKVHLTISAPPFIFEQTIGNICVPPFGRETVPIQAIPRPRVSCKDVCQSISVRLTSTDGTNLIVNRECSISDHGFRFTRDMRSTSLGQTQERFNVLVCGCVGSGKSSFVNTILTCFSPAQDIIHAAPIGSGDGTTTALDYYDVPDTYVRLIDTWGFSTARGNANDNLLHAAIGFLPRNFSKTDTIHKNFEKLVGHAGTMDRREADAVLFFVPAIAIDDPALMAEAKLFLADLRTKLLNVIVVLSRVDDVIPDARADPDCVKAMKSRLGALVGFKAGAIRECFCYHRDMVRVFDVERSCYGVLDTAVEGGKVFPVISRHFSSSQ